ncbi:hypothetical protein [Paenibacillus sp. Z6-24]
MRAIAAFQGTQCNASERDYLKNRVTGEEQTVKVPIGIVSVYSTAYTKGEEIGWITMKPTEQSKQYIVSTTDKIMPSREDPLKPIHFLVDVEFFLAYVHIVKQPSSSHLGEHIHMYNDYGKFTNKFIESD